jgi:spore maturation protein CgeB
VLKHQQIQTILLIGSCSGQTKQRFGAFQRLGYTVDFVHDRPTHQQAGVNERHTFLMRVFHKLGYPLDRVGVNKKAVQQAGQKRYHCVWVEKCLMLRPKTLKAIKRLNPAALLVSYTADDMFARHNQSRYYLGCLSLYDAVVTTKSYNCHAQELPALGARYVIFSQKGYDKKAHAPIAVSEDVREKLGADVGFVGTFEQDRAEKMYYLACQGIKVRIWGNGWRAFKKIHPNLTVEYRPLYDEDYQNAIASTKINLCFLRKLNRDLHTDRSVEIPACGGFMLAERTDEHQALFEEDKEAAYFACDDLDELLAKVNYFLTHDEKRQQIASAGRKRCEQDNYSHEARLTKILCEVLSHGKK